MKIKHNKAFELSTKSGALLTGIGYTTAFNPAQLNALALLFLDMHSHGYLQGRLNLQSIADIS